MAHKTQEQPTKHVTQTTHTHTPHTNTKTARTRQGAKDTIAQAPRQKVSGLPNAVDVPCFY